MGCEKEQRLQRVSSAKQRVPIIGSKRFSTIGAETGLTTKASSNAKLTQNEISNRFIHTKVKVKDFLSNETHEVDNENSKI